MAHQGLAACPLSGADIRKATLAQWQQLGRLRTGSALRTIRGDIRFVEDYPMTITGKVQKFVMRELTAKELAGGKAE
jgi:acyl-coenzyme A synthetase/AMP-(fatty) acid ligase